MNSFKHIDRTPWTVHQPIARALSTRGSPTHKKVDIHSCLERDSNPRPQCSNGPRQLGAATFYYCTNTCYRVTWVARHNGMARCRRI